MEDQIQNELDEYLSTTTLAELILLKKREIAKEHEPTGTEAVPVSQDVDGCVRKAMRAWNQFSEAFEALWKIKATWPEIFEYLSDVIQRDNVEVLQEKFDSRSVKWQESDAGQAVQAKINEWQEVVDRLADLEVPDDD